MSKYELLITNGDVVTSAGVQKMDIAVRSGRIVALELNLNGRADGVIDARDRLVFPGFFDAHTHMGVPIMETQSIDDFESGSIAAAFGGVTTIVDFTVQEKGQSLRDSIDARLKKAAKKSHVDYALHVNVTDNPGSNVQEIPKLIDEGFRYFKVFSTYRQTGMMIDWDEFRIVLDTVHRHGGLVFLHAEDNDLVERQTAANITAGNVDPPYHARSRTAEAEAKAIADAARIALELKARLYIVHLSSKMGLQTALEWRDKGAKLILETCPQYLVLDESYYKRGKGHYWITTPPLRTPEDSSALWNALANGDIDVVATDHCPFTVEQKDAGNRRFHETPNGIPGVETLFPLLYSHGVCQGRITLGRMVELLAGKPAEIFGLAPQKGGIAVGADADLVIWNPDHERRITVETQHGNADWSPYEGLEVRGDLEYTILRGQLLIEMGQFVGEDVFGELQVPRANEAPKSNFQITNKSQ